MLIARIIFSPLVAFTIGFLLLWWLPYATLATILGDRSDEFYLDLRFDSFSSDREGRILDIVGRVNTITSSESAKTNTKIDALDGVVQTLKKENASLKKMLSAIATKVGAELEDEDKDQQVEDEKNDDPDEPLGAEVDLEDENTREGGKASKPQRFSSGSANRDSRDTGDTSTVGEKKTQTHADVAAPKDEEGGGESVRESTSNPMIEPGTVQKQASKATGEARGAPRRRAVLGRLGSLRKGGRGEEGGREVLMTINCKRKKIEVRRKRQHL
ncbi:hypothetical protein TrVE_jg12518 [Triparma verrucosa]|uniref:Uncharacterized protein n=1 Tax=Triparma verrucosa TaxID=1606542 RepID=A0A9W7KUA0_9STRA|nr:hypothetical protein TrVE_jg12518 [Triparma verrucosa]